MLLMAVAGPGHAAQSASNIPIDLTVLAPTCTLTNSNSTIVLPIATSAAETFGQYVSVNNLVADSTAGAGWYSATALNQTSTMTCNSANVQILGFSVEPGASATIDPAAPTELYLVDGATVPNKAFGNLLVVANQLQVNGLAAPALYSTAGGAAASYGPFSTGPLTGGISTATVMWQPALSGTASNPVGQPQGGVYRGSFVAVVNY